MTALVWIQREFRVDYLPALQEALQEHDKVIVAYFDDPEKRIGRANSVWLSHALEQLADDFENRGGQLWIVNGEFKTELKILIEKYSVKKVYYSYQVGEPFFTLQQQAIEVCQQQKIALKPFLSEDFFDASQVTNQKGTPYLVFTPFYKSCQQKINQLKPLELTEHGVMKSAAVKRPVKYSAVATDLLNLRNEPWAVAMMQDWVVGEEHAWQQLSEFVEQKLLDYEIDRDYPELMATSLLSPYFHFGHINPVSSYFYLLIEAEHRKGGHLASLAWLRQLFWRSFSRYLLVWYPHTERQPFNAKYENMDWSHDIAGLQAWQQGKTGIPIIDAGMRELWATGYMHNRVRMLVASFLTKNLNVHWREGLRWFGDTLVDADPANNVMGWQWVAGCGVDASPYYRLFNPVVQSQKFDAQAEYIKKWIPELSVLSSKAVHEPWNHHAECQLKNIELGKDYPLPIVDLKQSRQQHLERVAAVKESA